MAKTPPVELRAWRALMHVHATVIDSIDETLRREVGIPGSWYEALVEIALAGGTMRMNEFARETTLTKSGATRFVDRLERAGLVRRETSTTDRRVSQLSLTEEGRRLQKAADPHVLRIVAEKFGDHVTGSEAEVMFTALDRSRVASSGLPSSP